MKFEDVTESWKDACDSGKVWEPEKYKSFCMIGLKGERKYGET